MINVHLFPHPQTSLFSPHDCFDFSLSHAPSQLFLEETSLVARPAIGFEELKARLEARLNHMGITVRMVHQGDH